MEESELDVMHRILTNAGIKVDYRPNTLAFEAGDRGYGNKLVIMSFDDDLKLKKVSAED